MSDDGTIESLSRSSSNSSVASLDSSDKEYEVCTKANGIRIQSHAQDSFLLRKHLCNINTCAGLKIDKIEGVSGYKEVVPGNILLGRKLVGNVRRLLSHQAAVGIQRFAGAA